MESKEERRIENTKVRWKVRKKEGRKNEKME